MLLAHGRFFGSALHNLNNAIVFAIILDERKSIVGAHLWGSGDFLTAIYLKGHSASLLRALVVYLVELYLIVLCKWDHCLAGKVVANKTDGFYYKLLEKNCMFSKHIQNTIIIVPTILIF